MPSLFSRSLVLLIAVLACVGLAAALPAPASATQSGTVTLDGYGGTSHVYTTENSYQLYTNFGADSGGEKIYLSIYPADFFTSYHRVDLYFITSGLMVPGTYTAAGGFRGYYDQPGLVVQDWVDYAFDDGGTFTVNSIDPANPAGLEFDISWTSSSGSGHAVFTAAAPPDTTPPSVVLSPSDTVVAVTTEAGTNVDFASHVSATDDRDPNPAVSCNPPSGSYFPLGYSEVWCTATDNAGNQSNPVLLRIMVLPPDTTPPSFTYLPNYVEHADDPNGVVLMLYMSASDDRSWPTIRCTVPPTGVEIGPWDYVLFPINAPGQSTTVSCVATDEAGNQTIGSFSVHVQGAWEMTGVLAARIDSWHLGKLGSSLHDKLVTVQRMLLAGKKQQALENLNSFNSQVDAVKSGTSLPDWWWQSWNIKGSVDQIRQVIG